MFSVDNFFQANKIVYCKIGTEILDILSLKWQGQHVDKKITQFLDSKFESILPISFSDKIVLWHAETVTDEILYILHDYFRNKCCNIQNIIILVSTIGLSTHYQNFCKLHKTVGFDILEIPLVNIIDRYLSNIKPKKINKNLKLMFSVYGGTYEILPPMRTFLLLFLSQYKHVSNIETMSTCGSTQNLENWLERETFFMNSEFVNKFTTLHKKYIDNNQILNNGLTYPIYLEKTFNEKLGQGSYQEVMDSLCFSNLIRETINFQSFNYISEKTFRCFYNHLIILPTDGKDIIDTFKKYNFWIPEDIIDYSYLSEDFFDKRIDKLDNTINNLLKFSIDDLQDYYNSNIYNYERNQQLVVDWPDIIQKKIEEKFNKQ